MSLQEQQLSIEDAWRAETQPHIFSFTLTSPQALFYYMNYGNTQKASMPGLFILPILLGNPLPGLPRAWRRSAQAEHERTDRHSRID
jgi:hypothetical protein